MLTLKEGKDCDGLKYYVRECSKCKRLFSTYEEGRTLCHDCA